MIYVDFLYSNHVAQRSYHRSELFGYWLKCLRRIASQIYHWIGRLKTSLARMRHRSAQLNVTIQKRVIYKKIYFLDLKKIIIKNYNVM